MAYNNFDKVEYEGNNYYPRDTKTSLVMGTQTGSTNVWTGALPEGINSYTDPENLIIDYFLPYDGTSSNATLNLSGLGAKPVYTSHGTDPITDEFEAKSVIRLAYVIDSALNSGNGAWKVVGSDASGSGGGGGDISVTKETIGTIGSNSWSAGTLPTLTTDTITADDITDYTQGVPTNISITGGVMTLTYGTPTTVTFTSRTIKSVNQFTQGTAPSLTAENKSVVTNVTSS